MTSRTICAACASGLLLLSGACGGSEQGSSQESADDGAATGAVIDDELLTVHVGEFLREDARHQIG